MPHALLIGGTRFIGRHTVREFRDAGYEVTLFTRGRHGNPFEDDHINHVEGDRTDEAELARAADVDPDVVVDLVAYYPRDVQAALQVFADVDAYVYVSSCAAYVAGTVLKRENDTALRPCTDEEATDDSHATYGARKAEGDRAVFAAAERGVDAVSVRPTVVYGPHDYSGRFGYWVQRVANYDRVLVPGDGTNIWHVAYVENVARALRVAAERGDAGQAYNVADPSVRTLEGIVEGIADVLDTTVDVVTAGERELGAADLESSDFPLYRAPPSVVDTNRLRGLGWDPVPTETGFERTVDASPHVDADGTDAGPDREAEERVLGVLDTL